MCNHTDEEGERIFSSVGHKFSSVYYTRPSERSTVYVIVCNQHHCFKTLTNDVDTYVHYEELVLVQWSPNNPDVLRGRRGRNSRLYLSGEVAGYCGTSVISY